MTPSLMSPGGAVTVEQLLPSLQLPAVAPRIRSRRTKTPGQLAYEEEVRRGVRQISAGTQALLEQERLSRENARAAAAAAAETGAARARLAAQSRDVQEKILAGGYTPVRGGRLWRSKSGRIVPVSEFARGAAKAREQAAVGAESRQAAMIESVNQAYQGSARLESERQAEQELASMFSGLDLQVGKSRIGGAAVAVGLLLFALWVRRRRKRGETHG